MLLMCASAFGAEELVTLNTREDVTQSYLLDYDKDESYRSVAILFPGGAGNIGLKPGVELRNSNFLVRTRDLFVNGGVAVAVIDGPSDASSMTDGFRMSANHATDIGFVVRDLRRRFPQAKIYLVGTSRGTVSAAFTGLALGTAVDGVVLTSSVFNPSRAGGGVSGVDFSNFKVPLLFVHHREDGCNVCPYYGASRLAGRFPLISVTGGLPPQSGPCDPLSAHGYFGKETETVTAITQWLTGKPYSAEIK
jgi:pimeloyl-ACP methyl ester carboxylesterase